MLLKTTFAVVYMASVVSATFFPVMPKCWRKCAREAGVMCQWTDLPCLCKAANNSLFIKANNCACHACGDDEFGSDDKASLDAKEFSFACKLALTPLDQAVIDAGYHSATCEGTPAPPPPPPIPPPPPAPSPPLVVPSPGYGWGWGSAPSSPISQPFGTKQPAVTSPTTTISVTVPAPSASKSSWGFSSSNTAAGYGNPFIGSGAYDSTQIIQSTVMISPVPVSTTKNNKASTTIGTATLTSTATELTKTSAKPTQFSGVAVAPNAEWAASMFALVAAVAYGIA